MRWRILVLTLASMSPHALESRSLWPTPTVIRPATQHSSEDPWRSRGRVSTLRPVGECATATLTPLGHGGTRTSRTGFRANLSLWLHRHVRQPDCYHLWT